MHCFIIFCCRWCLFCMHIFDDCECVMCIVCTHYVYSKIPQRQFTYKDDKGTSFEISSVVWYAKFHFAYPFLKFIMVGCYLWYNFFSAKNYIWHLNDWFWWNIIQVYQPIRLLIYKLLRITLQWCNFFSHKQAHVVLILTHIVKNWQE